MEVTIDNFNDAFPTVCDAIKEASFISIDLEMTGLYASSELKPSLFDTPQQRYNKQRQSVSKFFACQFGLTAFKKDPIINKYTAKCFSFYLCPRSFAETRSRLFSVDTSSLEFLCDYSMDLVKVFVKGIPFLNEPEEEQLRRDIANGLYAELTTQMKDEFTYVTSKIEANTPKESNKMFKIDYNPSINKLINYMFVQKLRDHFERIENLWIEAVENEIVATLLDAEEFQERKTKSYQECEATIDYMKGFTRVFEYLVECRKPLIGFNMMLDVLYLYNQFYQPLPKKLEKFKNGFLELFPESYDVKSIIMNTKKYFPELADVFNCGSLSEAHENFKRNEFLLSFLYQPVIECEFKEPDYQLHDAGFDSFAAGCIFLRIAHSMAMREVRIPKDAPTWNKLLKSVEECRNHINLIRANIHYLDLESDFSHTNRPKHLILSCKNTTQPVCVDIVSSLVSAHGLVDVKSYDRNRCLIATGNYKAARDLIVAIRKDDEYNVEFFDHFKHNTNLRFFLR